MTNTRETARAAVPQFDARVDRLRSFCQSGPNYIRRVRDELTNAFYAWDADQVGARLVTAEIAAGLRSTDDYPNRFDQAVWSTIPA